MVSRLASNLVILKQTHRVAWLIVQEKNMKLVGELDKVTYIPNIINLELLNLIITKLLRLGCYIRGGF